MNTIKRDYRLDEIVKYIKEAGYGLTMRKLAEEFNVTRRTIRNDIKRIKEDYPQVKTTQDNGGGVTWEE